MLILFSLLFGGDKEETVTNSIEVEEFTPDNLKYMLDSLGVESPDIVYKQAVLETRHFTSSIFLENNNLFGMKHPSVRETTSTGKNRGHARYDNWIDCVKDIALFQDYYCERITRCNDYYKFLNQIYATDPKYVQKVKSVKSYLEY